MSDRRRNALILLLVAGLIAASAAVIVVKKTHLGLDLKGGVELVYQGKPTAQSKVTPESLERAINIMRKRVDQLGVAQPEIQRSGAQEITVALPEVSNVKRAEKAVGTTAQLFFYDWKNERDRRRRKPRGRATPATDDARRPPRPGCQSTRRFQRAAKRPAILRKTDTTWTPGCTPAQANSCLYGSWYLLDTKHEKVLCAASTASASSTTAICPPEETEAGPLLRRLQTARRLRREGRARQPRDRAGGGASDGRGERQGCGSPPPISGMC